MVGMDEEGRRCQEEVRIDLSTCSCLWCIVGGKSGSQSCSLIFYFFWEWEASLCNIVTSVTPRLSSMCLSTKTVASINQ